MGQGPQVLPHPRVDGPVPPLHCISGKGCLPVLQDIVREQHAAGQKQPDKLRKPVDILPLCRVHEDKIIRAGEFRQNPAGIPLYQRDAAFFPRPLDILSRLGNPPVIILNRGDMALRPHMPAHQERGKSDRAPYFQDSRRPDHFHHGAQKGLGLLPDDRYMPREGFLLQGVEKFPVAPIQHPDILRRLSFRYHTLCPVSLRAPRPARPESPSASWSCPGCRFPPRYGCRKTLP